MTLNAKRPKVPLICWITTHESQITLHFAPRLLVFLIIEVFDFSNQHNRVLQGDTLAPYIFVIMLDYALRQAINGREEELGFQLHRRQSRRKGPVVVTDLDFVDDIALLSEQINQAQDLLTNVETSAAQIGLEMNAKKTKVMAYNHSDEVRIMTRDGSQLEIVQDFKYLVSWIDSTEKDPSRSV